jgi:hypothetical protein
LGSRVHRRSHPIRKEERTDPVGNPPTLRYSMVSAHDILPFVCSFLPSIFGFSCLQICFPYQSVVV